MSCRRLFPCERLGSTGAFVFCATLCYDSSIEAFEHVPMFHIVEKIASPLSKPHTIKRRGKTTMVSKTAYPHKRRPYPRTSQKRDHTMVEAMAGYGTHFVRALPSKRAVDKGWQDTKPSLDDVKKWLNTKGNLLGAIPGSVGLVVVDVDRGDREEVVAVLGKPITAYKSAREGRFHLLYAHPGGTIKNSNWQVGSAGGEIRGDNGYAIIWNQSKFLHAIESDATPVDYDIITSLPKPPRKGRGPEAVRNATQGTRNDILNTEVFKAAANGACLGAQSRLCGGSTRSRTGSEEAEKPSSPHGRPVQRAATRLLKALEPHHQPHRRHHHQHQSLWRLTTAMITAAVDVKVPDVRRGADTPICSTATKTTRPKMSRPTPARPSSANSTSSTADCIGSTTIIFGRIAKTP